MSSNSGTAGSDFHGSIYKLLNMTLACRPSNPLGFAYLFFNDEQHVEHELAHAIHQVRYFEENKIRFREQVSAIFFAELNTNEDVLPTTDCIMLNSAIKVMKALYGENLDMLSAILEHTRPGNYMSFSEFEGIIDLTIICLNFNTYLKTLICDAFNKSSPSEPHLSNVVSSRFLEKTFHCLQESSAALPNIMQEEISDVKWAYRASSALHALEVFQRADGVKLDEFLRECVSHYFKRISCERMEE